MTIFEEYTEQSNKRWQQRIVKTNFVTATVVLVFEIAYYFILTAIELRSPVAMSFCFTSPW